MERRAEISRFAVFLFCLLAPLGSLAPIETSENKMITAQRQKRFTTMTPSSAGMIEKEARELFEFYHKCVNATLDSRHKTFRSHVTDLVKRIPECPAFHSNCCALHHFYNILQTLEKHIETICTETARNVVANRNQLSTTLKEHKAFYTCTTDSPTQVYPQLETMSLADRKNYIWGVLKKYESITQITNSP